MNKILIHVSDIHFQKNSQENQNLVLNAFFKDIREQIIAFDISDVYFMLSGDIVHTGSDQSAYDEAYIYLNNKLDELRIGKENRVCLPGNHDISRDVIFTNKVEHIAITQKTFSEKEFNDYISDNPVLLLAKFNNYFNFKSKFAQYGIDEDNPTFCSFSISDKISIYCFNTSLTSNAGIDNIKDEQKLCIDTRSLQKALSDDQCPCKIAIMHHHNSLFSTWGVECFKNQISNNFSLSLAGHTHEQDLKHFVQNHGAHFIENTNPQLFSDKKDKLGYSIIKINDCNVSSITFREWHEKHSKFLAGISFSGNDTGIVLCEVTDTITSNTSVVDTRINIFENRLNDAMRAYSDNTPIWLNRKLSKTRSSYVNFKSDPKDNICIADIIKTPRSMFIQSPPQFGLSCLSHYLILQSWKNYSNYWLRVDLEEVKLKDIDKLIETDTKLFAINISDVKCIVIDSWVSKTKENLKILEKLKKHIPSAPIILMQTVESNQFFTDNISSSELEDIKEIAHLLPLNRGDIRALGDYRNSIEDEDSLVCRITADLEMLNMHRTPLNCFTLLAASSIDRTAVVNRTTLIERVLSLLFENDRLPKYMTKPDVKDCEVVLGCFCEKIIRSGNYSFTKDDLYAFITSVIEPRFLALDSECLFKILSDNSIIIDVGGKYKFKHSFWIYYFAARRMIDNQNFAIYIFDNKKYIDFPEIIEFYTGIDRKRDDALSVLAKDIKESCEKVKEKMGVSLSMTPYESLKWNPNPLFIEKVKKDFSADVQQSTLPKEIKDKHADSNYNPAKPFIQDVHSILSDYFVLILMRDIRAASMALRNSDYADGQLKNQLLKNITESWEQVAQIIVALSPILAMEGAAGCGGASFILSGDFGNDFDEKMKTIILKIPENIINWFQNDIASHKLGPLFFNHAENEDNKFRKHLIALLLIHDRPKNWKDRVLNYIGSLHKNSYYLYDLFSNLNIEYTYSFADDKNLRDLGYLIKACMAKHETGVEMPGREAIGRISDNRLPTKAKIE